MTAPGCQIHAGEPAPCALCLALHTAIVTDMIVDLFARNKSTHAKLLTREWNRRVGERLKNFGRVPGATARFSEMVKRQQPKELAAYQQRRAAERTTLTQRQIAQRAKCDRRHVGRLLIQGWTVEQIVAGDWRTKPGPKGRIASLARSKRTGR